MEKTEDRAISLMESLNITWEKTKGDYGAKNDCTKASTIIDVDAPDGYSFGGELHSLVCFDWQDVITRIKQMPLEKCADDCECKDGD